MAKGLCPCARLQFVQQAALGLDHAHEVGMVHRDIKPSNLDALAQADKASIKVLDFGLAKASFGERGEHGQEPLEANLSEPQPDTRRTDARHARLHGPGADRQRTGGRHPRRHLQPGLYTLLLAERPATISGIARLLRPPGSSVDARNALERCARGGADDHERAGGQDDAQGPETTVPAAERDCRGTVTLLQETTREHRISAGRDLRSPGQGLRSPGTATPTPSVGIGPLLSADTEPKMENLGPRKSESDSVRLASTAHLGPGAYVGLLSAVAVSVLLLATRYRPGNSDQSHGTDLCETWEASL